MKAAEIHTAKMKATEMKETQTNKSGKKEVEIPSREAKRITGSFNLENEINKIKILVPLVELEKNPTYRKQIAKMINFSDIES
jgi:hypothetical protein